MREVKKLKLASSLEFEMNLAKMVFYCRVEQSMPTCHVPL